jgi:lipoyl(octanoyl) transferase
MKAFCLSRIDDTPDEVWFVEHPPVFTQGVSGKPEHILSASDIPVIQSDRGGQVTYHGPGQLVMYVLFDLTRLGIGIRALVDVLENITITGLKMYGLTAKARKDAPGVYIDDKKIASLGLRVKKGCSYHGLSVNINMDLTPFSYINPCGYQGLEVTQLSEHGVKCQLDDFAAILLHELKTQCHYSQLTLGPNILHV